MSSVDHSYVGVVPGRQNTIHTLGQILEFKKGGGISNIFFKMGGPTTYLGQLAFDSKRAVSNQWMDNGSDWKMEWTIDWKMEWNMQWNSN